METTTINKLKKGDYFKTVSKDGKPSKKVYVYEGYCRVSRAYVYTDFNDICNDHTAKRDKLVTTDFIF